MVKDFILEYIRLIVKYPDLIKYESNSIDEEAKTGEITIYVHPDDVGRVIGKDGKMISSIKTVVSGCKPKGGLNYKVNIKPIQNG
ncbi:MAG: KH domain-containing protein [Epsilonproteobacteria bacterium]|nr:KH domain-containing protein [Campylobacterota bacterium]